MKETNLLRAVQLGISKLRNSVTFRNNVGMGWIGESRRISKPTTITLPAGSVVIMNARPLHAGLCEGSADLVGWTVREVTAEMVGSKVAVFTALEVKTASGRVSNAQLTFIENVRNAGGIAGIVRSADEAAKMIQG